MRMALLKWWIGSIEFGQAVIFHFRNVEYVEYVDMGRIR